MLNDQQLYEFKVGWKKCQQQNNYACTQLHVNELNVSVPRCAMCQVVKVWQRCYDVPIRACRAMMLQGHWIQDDDEVKNRLETVVYTNALFWLNY